MSNEQLTEIVCVLDRSGSMDSILDDAIGGFNAFLKAQKELDEGECRMTIAIFDNEYETLFESVDVQEIPDFNKSTYVPRGGTALNDAIGRSIKKMGEIFDKREEKDKPSKVLFVILTDGQENSSKEYTLEQVKELVDKQKNEWNWEFIFLSSDMSAFNQGASFGFSHVTRFANTGDSTRHAYDAISLAASNYRSTGDTGEINSEIS